MTKSNEFWNETVPEVPYTGEGLEFDTDQQKMKSVFDEMKVKGEFRPSAERLKEIAKNGADLLLDVDINEEFGGIMSDDMVNHPPHYTSHPSGIECIQVTEHMSFCLGNAIKYLWRADLKADSIEDMKKAIWYIEREIAKRTK